MKIENGNTARCRFFIKNGLSCPSSSSSIEIISFHQINNDYKLKGLQEQIKDVLLPSLK